MDKAGSRILGIVLAGVLGPALAMACGDKLAMMGGGVGFERINQSVHRGSVVMIVPPNSSLRAANEALDLKGTLERAGHRVRTVDSLEELAALLTGGGTDVVLVDLREAGEMHPAARTETIGAEPPSVLTVLYKPGKDEIDAASRRGQCVARADKRRGHQLLEAVEQVLEQRQKGLPATCSTPGSVAST
jgi:DNA-binding NtrC family response regulator